MEDKTNNKYEESIILNSSNDIKNNENSLINSSTSKEQKNSLISSEYPEEINNKNSENNKEEIKIYSINISTKYIKQNSIQEFKEKEISCKPAKDKEDFFFKKKFFAEEWFKRSNYIDIDLIQDHLSSFKYLWCECQNLELICTEKLFQHAMTKPDLFESKNVRNIVRNGIPPKYMNKFILKLFNITKSDENLINNYKKILEISLKGYKTEYLENYFPTFTSQKKLEDVLPIHFLNKRGILALKEILWMIYHLYPHIEFCPLIIQLLSLILIFCNKYEALEIMSCIICYNINYDKNEIYKIRWHFRLNYNDNIKIITSISECLREVSYKSGKELYNHLTHIHFRPEILYEDLCFGFFYKYFNFFGMIRFLPFYLHEGIKSVYRLIYAIEKLTKDELLLIKSPDNIISRCRELCNSLDNIKDLFEISYTLSINRNNNKFSEQNEVSLNNKNISYKYQFCLPSINKKSMILNEYQIIHLWEIFPIYFKTNNADVCPFTPSQSSIMDIIKKFNNEESKFIVLIKTTMNEIFGFSFVDKFCETSFNQIKLNKGFLFTIEPEIKIYHYNPDNHSDTLDINNEYILIGDESSESVALKISGDLSIGETHESECFNSPCFINKSDGKFKIEIIEVFKLF